MAICALNRNLTRTSSCGYSLPEIVDIYLLNYDDVSATTVSAGTAENEGCEEISAITLKEGRKVYHVVPAKGSASFEDSLTVEDAGNKYRHASVSFNVSGKYDACMHGALDALSLGRYFVVIKTADGNYLGMGRLSPIEAEVVTLAGGSDNNGMQVTLSGNIAESSLPLSDGAVTTVLANVLED